MSFSYLLLIVMVAASIGLSVVSGYETFLGLLNFMPDGPVGTAFGGIFTLAVQAILFVISWRIAQHLLDPLRQQIPSFAVWLICAFFSGYFSYFGFFQATGGRDENTRADAVLVAQSNILDEIADDISADLDETFTIQLVQGTSYRGWSDGLDRLFQIAAGAKPQIERVARAREAELSEERAALNKDLDGLQEQRVQAEAEVRIAEQRRGNIQSEIESLNQQIATLQSNIEDSRAEVQGLQAQLEAEGLTGQGPRYRQVEIDLGTARAKLSQAETRMGLLQSRLEERLREQVAEDMAAEQNLEQNSVNAILEQIDALNARIETMSQQIEESREAIKINFSEEGEGYRQRIARMQDHDYEAYSELEARCELVQRQLTDVGLGDDVRDIQCTMFDVAGVVTQLREKVEQREAFLASCDQDRASVLRPEGGAPRLNPIIAQLQNVCVGYAPTPSVREHLSRRLTSLFKDRGDDALAFDSARVALLVDWQSNAVISAVFAVIVDLLVLLCALVGRNVGQPERVRAIDMIISRLRMPEPNEQSFERRLILPSDGNERTMMQPILTYLLSEELAEMAETPEDAPQVLLLHKGGMQRLKAMKTETLRGAAAEAEQAPLSFQSRPGDARGRF